MYHRESEFLMYTSEDDHGHHDTRAMFIPNDFAGNDFGKLYTMKSIAFIRRLIYWNLLESSDWILSTR